MKFNKFLIAVSLFLFCLSIGTELFAGEIQATSKIREVTVYLQGARIYRTGTASITPGTNVVVFSGLSDQIDERSVEILSNGAFQVLSVNYSQNQLKTLQRPESSRKIEASYDSAALKLEFTKNEKTALEAQLEALKANQQLGINEKTLYAEDVEEWIEVYKKRTLDIKNRITKIQITINDIEKIVEKYRLELGKSYNGNDAPSGEIKVTVLSSKYDNADFKINYYVPAARWEPSYNLRAGKLSDPINLDYDALIYQTTNEEWKDVKLTLNTGNPTLGGNKPKLNSWFLDYYDENVGYYNTKTGDQGVVLRGGRANGTTYLADGVKVAGNQKLAKAYEAIPTAVTNGSTNTSFEISLKYSVMPDGLPQQVRIQQNQLPATFDYAAVPKYDKDAFLEAKIAGWEQYNLLPGNANLFLEGTYVGKSYLNPIATGDTFSLSFGRDRKLNIERLRIQTEGASNKVLSGGNKKEYFVYEITVRNLKTAVADLTLEDQIPLSQTKDIEVEVKEKELSGANYDKETGKLTWKLKLLPSETKKVKFGYTVIYPKNRVISNLNR